MIEHLPQWLNLLFCLVVLAVLILFYFSNGKNGRLLAILVLWTILQSVLGYIGFYDEVDSVPPRIAFLLGPVFLFTIYGLTGSRKEWVLNHRNHYVSTFLHTVRIPVEICLAYLFVYKMVPELMTYHGRNFDILAGITAIPVGLLLLNKKIKRVPLLIWNVVCLGLVLFILVNGLLSAETPLQQFAFDQPNRALLFFPYVLLPAVVVPIVIFTHISDIMLLMRTDET